MLQLFVIDAVERHAMSISLAVLLKCIAQKTGLTTGNEADKQNMLTSTSRKHSTEIMHAFHIQIQKNFSAA
jgi:hypothetical protein